MLIDNLEQKVFQFVAENWPEARADHRFRGWVKIIEKVDPEGKNGWAFEGRFLKSGTVEMEDGRYVLLVKTTNGSRRYRDSWYSVVILEPDGSLTWTGITTDDHPGWALRIRDRLLALVQEVQGGEGPARPAWFPEDVWGRLDMKTKTAVAKAAEGGDK